MPEVSTSVHTPAQPNCNGSGWVKNPQHGNGYFSCRGCPNCENAAPPAPAVETPRLTVVGAPPVVAAATPMSKEPEKYAPKMKRCEATGQVHHLKGNEATTRKTLCPTCKQLVKIKDKDFLANCTSVKMPKHEVVESRSLAPEQAPAIEPAPAPKADHPDPPRGSLVGPEEFGGEDFPPPEDHGPSPHDIYVEHYQAPDALPGQLAIKEIVPASAATPSVVEVEVRVAHTLEEVEAAGGYKVIYADPPWSYVQQGRGVAENHYRTMSIEDIKALPIGRLASKDSVLFLWGTWPQLPDVLATMEAWGFKYKTCGFVWTKHHESSGKECVGGGFWTRSNSEFVLIGVRGKNHPKRIDKAVRQLINAPRGEHSEKPAEVRDRIYQLMGELPMIELFARDRDERFDAWGDQVPGGSDVVL